MAEHRGRGITLGVLTALVVAVATAIFIASNQKGADVPADEPTPTLTHIDPVPTKLPTPKPAPSPTLTPGVDPGEQSHGPVRPTDPAK